MTPETIMHREIVEQPHVLARTLSGLSGVAEAAAHDLQERGARAVVTVGRGSSDHVARYSAYVLTIHGGLLVADAAPSIVTAYAVAQPFPNAAVLAISQSGAGADVAAVAAAGHRAGAPVIAITNTESSPLAALADHALVTPAWPELSIPATKSYTAALAAVALLGRALARRRGTMTGLRSGDLARLPAAVERVLSLEPELAAMAKRLVGRDRCAVLGRGYNRATAAEVALKIQETSYVAAQDHGASDFLHGPVAVVERDFDLLAIVAGGPTAASVVAVIARASALGARVMVISDGAVDRRAIDVLSVVHVHLGTGLSEVLSPFAFAVAGQFVALHLALAAGHSPDQPRSLAKVTVTQ